MKGRPSTIREFHRTIQSVGATGGVYNMLPHRCTAVFTACNRRPSSEGAPRALRAAQAPTRYLGVSPTPLSLPFRAGWTIPWTHLHRAEIDLLSSSLWTFPFVCGAWLRVTHWYISRRCYDTRGHYPGHVPLSVRTLRGLEL